MGVNVRGQATGIRRPGEAGRGRASVLLASGIGRGGGIFALGEWGTRRLSDVPTTGMATWGFGSQLASISWTEVDPAPPTSSLARRNGTQPAGAFEVAVREPHALLWSRGLLHAVSTSDNSIVSLDAMGRTRDVWKAPGDGDCWHLNSLTVHGGQLVASAFGRFSHHREWAENERRHGAGIVFETGTGREILGGLSCPHDPTFIDGSWIVCNSAERAVVRFDTGGEEIARVDLDGWTRGVAWDSESLFVGVSAHRMLGDDGRARVARLDRRSLEKRGEWELPCPEVFALSWAAPDVVAGYEMSALAATHSGEPAPLAA